MASKRVAITGAFSYTGRYLARLALDAGHSVTSLSRRTEVLAPAPLTAAQVRQVKAAPLDFSDEAGLGRSLEGCDVLFCTYFVRFARNGDSHAAAADRCARLFELARQAGVQKVVFTSHTQTSEESPFPYIAGKAKAEAALRATGLPSYAIARPCGVFGDTPNESILMNNAAWVLRRVPLFLLAGDGSPRFQPIHVRDFADLLFELGGLDEQQLAVGAGAGPRGVERDACGPEALSSRELFEAIGAAVGSRSLVRAPGFLPDRAICALTWPINWWTGDVLLDADDLGLLTSGLTTADDPADPAIAGRRSLLAWLAEVGPGLGVEYVSSMQRYYK